jgi:hypothetical protein
MMVVEVAEVVVMMLVVPHQCYRAFMPMRGTASVGIMEMMER